LQLAAREASVAEAFREECLEVIAARDDDGVRSVALVFSFERRTLDMLHRGIEMKLHSVTLAQKFRQGAKDLARINSELRRAPERAEKTFRTHGPRTS
jgi:hypothetical protein